MQTQTEQHETNISNKEWNFGNRSIAQQADKRCDRWKDVWFDQRYSMLQFVTVLFLLFKWFSVSMSVQYSWHAAHYSSCKSTLSIFIFTFFSCAFFFSVKRTYFRRLFPFWCGCCAAKVISAGAPGSLYRLLRWLTMPGGELFTCRRVWLSFLKAPALHGARPQIPDGSKAKRHIFWSKVESKEEESHTIFFFLLLFFFRLSRRMKRTSLECRQERSGDTWNAVLCVSLLQEHVRGSSASEPDFWSRQRPQRELWVVISNEETVLGISFLFLTPL